MEELLKPVKVTKARQEPQNLISEIRSTGSKHSSETTKSVTDITNVSTPQEALEGLRSQPSARSLSSILTFLAASDESQASFHISESGPLASQILYALVNTIIPDYWRTVKNANSRDIRDLLRCLRNVAGIGAILARMKALVVEAELKHIGKAKLVNEHLHDVLDVLSSVLDGADCCNNIWRKIEALNSNDTKRNLTWKEYVSQVAGGKLLTVAAQAQQALQESSDQSATRFWISSGEEYASWLGSNIAAMIQSDEGLGSKVGSAASKLFGTALSLGYRSQLTNALYGRTVLDAPKRIKHLSSWLPMTAAHDRQRFLEDVLRHVLPKLIGRGSIADFENGVESSKQISAAAALLQTIARNDLVLMQVLQTWLKDTGSQTNDGNLSIIRACISALASDEDSLQNVLEFCMVDFGDSIYIKHTPEMQQEIIAQTMLICAGYIHRRQPMALFMSARSSKHMQGVSTRLAASSPRARFLGMVVGVTISNLVDKPELRMKFEFDESEQSEVNLYAKLPLIDDIIGRLEDLHPAKVAGQSKQRTSGMSSRGSKKSKPIAPAQTEPTGPRIIEILDESDDDDDLVPYGKPDSDPEDEDDDPSVAQRNKPTAPVYIRDLIASVKDSENYDRHTLALRSAANLIRRKANFGKEVRDHIDDLAELFISLQDHFDLDDFPILRQNALIAILIAHPAHVGQYYTRAYFDGDYSIAQRIAVLTAIGLGTRELAGFTDFDQDTALKSASSAFPTKTLSPHLHSIYADENTSPVQQLSAQLERTMIQPLALEAADKATGPNILKIRTFSSRMEVEKKRKKPIANELAKVVAQNFFFPLTGRWWSHIQSYGPETTHSSQHLLPMFLQTLALLMHSSGPSTLSLPSMTSEFWDLLLSLRTRAVGDRVVLSGWLFAMLTMLEVNEDGQHLATAHAKELLETQVWVKGVWEGMSGGKPGSVDERVRVLAATVLVRIQEVVDKYQRLLMGDMMSFER